MNAAKRHEIFSRLRAANPHPTTELEYSTPFELLVAVVLSAQSTDKGVNLATRRLFPVARTPEAIYALGQAGLENFIKTIGLYKSKAKHLIETCRLLIERHGGEVPAEREALEALPGVGRKTANVILNTAFGQPTMAVDTHIFRVANRIGLAPGKTVLEVERIPARRPPLADPAWPLRMRGAQAQMRRMHPRRPVRIQGQDLAGGNEAATCAEAPRREGQGANRAESGQAPRRTHPRRLTLHVQPQPRPGPPVLLRRMG